MHIYYVRTVSIMPGDNDTSSINFASFSSVNIIRIWSFEREEVSHVKDFCGN